MQPWLIGILVTVCLAAAGGVWSEYQSILDDISEAAEKRSDDRLEVCSARLEKAVESLDHCVKYVKELHE